MVSSTFRTHTFTALRVHPVHTKTTAYSLPALGTPCGSHHTLSVMYASASHPGGGRGVLPYLEQEHRTVAQRTRRSWFSNTPCSKAVAVLPELCHLAMPVSGAAKCTPLSSPKSASSRPKGRASSASSAGAPSVLPQRLTICNAATAVLRASLSVLCPPQTYAM